MSRIKKLFAGTALILGSVLFVSALASAQQKGAPRVPTVSSIGGPVLSTGAVTEGAAFQTTSNAYVALPLATVRVTIPPGMTGYLVANFSAESVCFGAAGWCTARILVNGAEMNPVVGTDFAFDSSDNNTETGSSWEGRSMTRTSNTLGTGTHIVSVQVATVGTPMNFRVDDYALVVQAIAK